MLSIKDYLKALDARVMLLSAGSMVQNVYAVLMHIFHPHVSTTDTWDLCAKLITS